jgi:RimJ/RimL family protein N-acetyltransferase
MVPNPIVATERLRLEAFSEADAGALAAILADPEVSKNLTADASTPERCLASARKRISWHNKPWSEVGYGVWAIRSAGDVVGWCGFVPPDIGVDPEILYGLARSHWGRGLGREAASAAIDWLFANTRHAGVSAVVFGRVNPASTALILKLGMRRRGAMAMADFLPDMQLARAVLEYEVWRLGRGPTHDPEALLFHAPHKAGQVASLWPVEAEEIQKALCRAARGRAEYSSRDPGALEGSVRDAFRLGLREPYLDWYNLSRGDWRR